MRLRAYRAIFIAPPTATKLTRTLGEEGRDARPIGFVRSERSRVTSGDRGLERVPAPRAAELLGALERGQATTDEQPIPQRTVLVIKQDRFSRRTYASHRARCLNLHERHQPVDLRLPGSKLGQDTPQAQRV